MASIRASDLLTPAAKGLRLSATLEINELVRQRLDAGKRVVHLGFGEATFPMQKDVLQAHREASSDTSYLPVAGLPTLREVSGSFRTITPCRCGDLWLFSPLHNSKRAVWAVRSRQTKLSLLRGPSPFSSPSSTFFRAMYFSHDPRGSAMSRR